VDERLGAARARLARTADVLDLRAAAPLVDDDFFDSVHLVSSGREKLWPLLRSSLAGHLRGCGPAR
jgi:hypothetical protein